MVDSNRHVTWGHLQYYDAQIKKYVENAINTLEQSTISAQEKADIVKRLSEVEQLANINKVSIEAVAAVNKEQDSLIATLFTYNTSMTENVARLQQNIVSLATKEELATQTARIDSIKEDIDRLESSLKDDQRAIANIRVAIENKADKTYVDELIKNIPQISLVNYFTKDEVLNLIPDVDNFVTKEEVAKLDGKLLNALDDISELENAVDTDHKTLENIQLSLKGDYYTKDEVEAKLPDVSKFVTEAELASTLTPFATEEFVIKKIAEAELSDQDVDLSAYYTKTETEAVVKAAIDAIDIPDVSDLVTKEELEDAINNIEHPTVDLSDYYTKAEVDEAIANVEHPTIDLDGYATEQWVNQQGFLTEHQDLSDYAKKSDIPSLEGYAKLTDIPTDYLVESDIANKADKSDLEGLASTDYVEQAIARIPETDVSNLATKSELEAVEAKIPTDYLTTIPEEYVTKTELDAEGFVKSLEGYATETFVTDAINNIKHPDPDLSNYYTKGETDSAINEAIDGIKIPEVDLTLYATKAQVAEQVAAKADNVLFTENLIVTNSVGGFLADESVTGLTIKEILYKLLSLKEVVTPETPGGASLVVQDIIDNRRPIYSQDAEGNLVETPFDYVVWSVEDAANEHDGENDFYQIVDAEGNLIESGYHESTEYQEEAYLTIALPSTVTSVTAKMWDPDSNDFVEQNWKLIPTEDEHTNGYTVWTVPEEYEVLSGDVFRFVINN